MGSLFWLDQRVGHVGLVSLVSEVVVRAVVVTVRVMQVNVNMMIVAMLVGVLLVLLVVLAAMAVTVSEAVVHLLGAPSVLAGLGREVLAVVHADQARRVGRLQPEGVRARVRGRDGRRLGHGLAAVVQLEVVLTGAGRPVEVSKHVVAARGVREGGRRHQVVVVVRGLLTHRA